MTTELYGMGASAELEYEGEKYTVDLTPTGFQIVHLTSSTSEFHKWNPAEHDSPSDQVAFAITNNYRTVHFRDEHPSVVFANVQDALRKHRMWK